MQKKIFFWASVLYSILFVSAFVALTTIYIKERSVNDSSGNLIILTFAMVVLNIIIVAVQVLLGFSFFEDSEIETANAKQFLILSIVTLNLVSVIWNSMHIKWKWKKLRIEKFKVLDITFMGMIVALFIILDYVMGFVQLPAYTSLSLKFLPLFFMAYAADFVKTFIVCAICGVVSWFMPGNLDAGMPGAFMFDYFLPIVTISICCFIRPIKTNSKMVNVTSWFIFVTVPTIIIYLSRVIAGVLFYAAYAWENYSIWVYSLALNAINTTVDYVLFLVAVPSMCKTLNYIVNRLKQNR
ncbi:energy-coupled thiamine transporter ThiT [Mesoplasma seiffertii]|uniref:energy-coupled thiamine transporter ThiT n=1 Tax=Mesoplasma seiffertii TaxID=28224 RepID=UPI00047D2E60|nr:energy-coupled thiamine transporter ThiT [Mesoplasma seiffertii]